MAQTREHTPSLVIVFASALYDAEEIAAGVTSAVATAR